jgi:hypothetical protein
MAPGRLHATFGHKLNFIYVHTVKGEVVCHVKSNMEKMKYNGEIHDHSTCQKLDLHTKFCRTKFLKNSGANMGIKLYIKLPNTIK